MMAPLIERHLAAALRNEPRPWPASWAGQDAHKAVLQEILYHGVAGLLIEKAGRLDGWPDEVMARVHDQAVGQAMRELRHRAILSDLLSSLAKQDVIPLFLKGTAVAYDLYDCPANRARGDSDVLVADYDLDQARSILKALGFCPADNNDGSIETELQQSWALSCDDGAHDIDLHWQVMNSPALKDMLTYRECSAASIALPRLSPDARGMDRVRTLIHTCMHRAMHITAPYFVGGRTYYGGDRLIWTYDIQLLANALSPAEWLRLCALCHEYGASAVCLDGLRAAEQSLATRIPDDARAKLAAAPRDEKASHYLLHSRQLGRAWQDLAAVRGVRRKLVYLRARILPSARFVRAKYGDRAHSTLAQLYLRRIVEFIWPHPQRGQR